MEDKNSQCKVAMILLSAMNGMFGSLSYITDPKIRAICLIDRCTAVYKTVSALAKAYLDDLGDEILKLHFSTIDTQITSEIHNLMYQLR